ncbi:MAG: NAD(P)/FAD-dependent oxidoreductase [Bacteroidota bacterium]
MMEERKADVIIVGAGPAGLGVAVLLQELGIDFLILEKEGVGASFKKWPKETQFISPSFTGNFFKMPDLNAVTPDTSPALSLLTEHPTGEDYAVYLEGLADFYELPIEVGVEVFSVAKERTSFALTTSVGAYQTEYLIWAAGEYQYPKKNGFPGADLCRHYADITSFSELKGEEHIVIGSYESGFDAATHLVKGGKRVTLLDSSNYLELVNSDSSYSLSPFTRDRIQEIRFDLEYVPETLVTSVEREEGQYRVRTLTGESFLSTEPPINCTGFATSLRLIEDLFLFKKGYPLLNEKDESTKTKNLFLVGPQVKHKNALFCFIFKYRQRFAIVAESVARRKRVNRRTIKEALKDYKELNFYLKDLSCCDGECVC